MADATRERALDALLTHREPLPGHAFVRNLLQRTHAARRRRRAILLACGLTGSACAAWGATLLAEPVAQLFAAVPGPALMQTVLLAGAVTAFYAWVTGDDLHAPG